MPPVELVWDAACTVGECPTWDAARQRLWFTDIIAGRLHALDVASGARRTWDFPETLGSLGLCRSGRLVLALRSRAVLFDPETGATEEFSTPVDEPPDNRLNDGKVGPDGAFWVGSMDERPVREPTGILYRITPDGRVERKLDGLKISNGLAWSPDGRTMYHADPVLLFIDAWDFDPASGRIARRRRIATLTVEEGRPDGAATDAEGCYWSAGVSAGCLNRFSPEGELLAKVALPVPTPTMPCFAGSDLYVTSLREGASPEALTRCPGMGGLFRMKAPLPGAPVGLFAD